MVIDQSMAVVEDAASSTDAARLCRELRDEDPEVYAEATAILSAILERVRARRRSGAAASGLRAIA